MNIQIDDINLTDYFSIWIAAFTNGEGSFNIIKDDRSNLGVNYRCSFHLCLRDDDRPILREICDTLKIGKVYDELASCSNDGYNHQPRARFVVQSINGCVKLMRLFEKYPLQTKKQRDFLIWKQAVREMRKPAKYRNSDLLEYYYLKIREVRRYEEEKKLVKPQIKELQLTLKFSTERQVE